MISYCELIPARARMSSSAQDLPVSGSEVRSELDGLNSSESSSPARIVSTAPNKRVRVHRHRLSCWSFQMAFSADLTTLNGGPAPDSATLRDRQAFLHAHLRSRVQHTMPDSVTFVSTLYDTSILSEALPEGVTISISLRGYVQISARSCCEISTMQTWIPSAILNPVLSSLASISEFRVDVLRSEDPNDKWTQWVVFGSIGLNNAAKIEMKKRREASHLHSIVLSVFIRFGLECNILMRCRTTGGE